MRRSRSALDGLEPDARVFTTEAGTPLSDRNVARRVLAPATEAAGLGEYRPKVKGGAPVLAADGEPVSAWWSWVTLHTFRHTCASVLIEQGRRIEQVSAWLGHTDPGFTLRTYVHLMDDGVGDAAFMDDLAAEPGLRAVA